jgi:GDP-4-dehydro-6-deoxy-D-mannose reductase
MKRVLITGSSGFVGKHLVNLLSSKGFEVIGASLVCTNNLKNFKEIQIDLSEENACKKLIHDISPDATIHLAGMAHVQVAGEKRLEMIQSNILSTIYLAKAQYELRKESTFVLASSAQMYKSVVKDNLDESIINEDSPISYELPYAMGKMSAEFALRSLSSEHFKTYIMRPFNHIGPGQSDSFVCPGLAKRIFHCKDGGTISVGNLESKRDFTDVRDIVKAYALVLEKKPKSNLFILGSGRATKMQQIFDFLTSLSGKKIYTQVDQKLIRSQDPPCFVADAKLAKEELGWSPSISLEQSLRDIYEDVQKIG